MSIKLLRRHKSPNWYLRGTLRGIRVDESTGLTDKRQAKEFLAIRQAEILSEAIHGPETVKTFADAVVSYLEEGGDKKHLPPLLDIFGETKLSKIGQAEIVAAAKKLSATSAGGKKSPATLNRQVYTPMSAVLHHAARLKWCALPALARPKQPEGRVRHLTKAEARRLIEAAPDHLRPLVVFLLFTGARLAEALYLDWSCVDLVNRRVRLEDTKNGESRGVPLHAAVVAELRALPGRSGCVFRRPDGAAYASRNGAGGGQVKTAWKSMLKRAEITDFTPHDCRHTWATWHYAANRDVLALMTLGGWKSEKMVLRYAHFNPDNHAAGIDLIAPDFEADWGKSGGGPCEVSDFSIKIRA